MNRQLPDNLSDLLRYRDLLMSRSTVVCNELEGVTRKIAEVLRLAALDHPSMEPLDLPRVSRHAEEKTSRQQRPQ